MEADSSLTLDKIEAILEMRRRRAATRVPGEGENPAVGKRITDFDPRKPNRLNKQQMNMISGFFEKATESLAKKIIADLRMDVETHMVGLMQEKYDAFIETLDDPGCYYTVDFSPMKTPVVMTMELPLAFALVDRYLGGTGEVEIEERALTEVEMGLSDRFVDTVIRCVAPEWKRVVELNPSLGERFSDPDKLEVTTDKDVLLVASYQITGAVKFGSFKLCFPFAALGEYLDIMDTLVGEPDREIQGLEEWGARLERNICKVEVGLPVVLGEVDIPVNEFLDLKKEDVIVIDKKIASTVEMQVGSEAVIEGNVGMHNDRLAMKVIGVRRRTGDPEKEETTHG